MAIQTLIKLANLSPMEYVEELFESVTLDQLRLVLSSFYKQQEEVPAVRTRADAIKHIWATGQSRAKIADSILSVEAKSGMKHCFLSRFNDTTALQTFFSTPLRSTFSFGRVEARLARIEDAGGKKLLTIEHYIPVIEWVDVDEETKTKQQRLQRHPLIICFDTDRLIVTVSYPGFSQGSGTRTSDRLTYEYIVTSLFSYLREKFSFSVLPLPIHAALMALQEAESPRVKIIRSELEGITGKMLVTSGDDSKSVVDMVLDMLASNASTATRKELTAVITDGLRVANSNSLVAVWNPECVYTRALFWDAGAELLFIWNATTPNATVVDAVVQLLSEMAISMLRPHGPEAWTVVGELKPGEVVTVNSLVQQSSTNQQDAKKVILEAVRAGILVPVYRLRTNDLVTTARNGWTRDLASIATVHLTDQGFEIDGRDPRNVEVAFQRISEELAA